MNQIRTRDSQPIHSFGYEQKLRILVVWFRGKKTNSHPKPYIYVGPTKDVFDRMKALNVSASAKRRLEDQGRKVPSLGSYVNTKLKKYPTLDVRGTVVNWEILAAKRVSGDVKTKSTRKS